jgi:hypothetical protein
MADDALTILRRANRKLQSALAQFRPGQTRCSAITANDFSSLLSELLLAGECMRTQAEPASFNRGPNPEEAAALAREAHAYRQNLTALKHVLPGLHGRLLAEKSRLQHAQDHIAAATAWARASRKTL